MCLRNFIGDVLTYGRPRENKVRRRNYIHIKVASSLVDVFTAHILDILFRKRQRRS